MEENSLIQLQKIENVSAPDFLLDAIVTKIKKEEERTKSHTRILMAAAVLTLFVNIGIVSNYNSTAQKTEIGSDVSTYSYTAQIYSDYE